MIEQILKISLMNLRNLPSRIGISSVVVVGIGGVVGVLVAILAMASGFETALSSGASPDRVIVLRDSSSDEMSSVISTEEIGIVENLPGIAAISTEIYTVVDVEKQATGTFANLVARGVSEGAFEVRPEIKIVEGENFQTGRNQIIAGVKAASEFRGLDVGSTVSLRNSTWEVVGHFEAAGSAYESEIWLDYVAAQSAFRRTLASSIRIRLDSPASLQQLSDAVAADPRLPLDVRAEQEFLEGQSTTLRSLIKSFGYGVAVIMAIGALFAALNTMYTAVSARKIEIATLRAIGFSSVPIVISVMIEALVLAFIGGSLGALFSYFAFNGFTVSTLNAVTFSQVAFAFNVSTEIVGLGLIWALVIGFIGGLLPAINSATIPITLALRDE